MAIESQGMVVYWSTSTSFATSQIVNDVTSIGGPGISAGKLDTTTLTSTAKEFILGLRDNGDISLDMIYNSTDAGQVALRNDLNSRTKRRVGVKIPDSTTSLWHCEAYCTNWSLSGSVDNVQKLSATIGLSGAITWTTTA